MRFFLTGVLDTAEQAVQTAQASLRLFDTDRQHIETLGRPAGSALRVHQLLQTKPIVSIPSAARTLGLTAPTVATALGHLQRLGLVHELTQRRRHRLFAYEQYLALLNHGTELV